MRWMHKPHKQLTDAFYPICGSTPQGVSSGLASGVAALAGEVFPWEFQWKNNP
jgi:hypothetical protein